MCADMKRVLIKHLKHNVRAYNVVVYVQKSTVIQTEFGASSSTNISLYSNYGCQCRAAEVGLPCYPLGGNVKADTLTHSAA